MFEACRLVDSPAGHSSTAPPKYLPQTSCHFAPRAPSCPRRSRAWQNRHPGKFEPAKMATPQKTKGIKHHPILSDSDRRGLVLDTFGICLWREQGRRAAPREKSVGRCARKWGVEERKDGVDVELRDFVYESLAPLVGWLGPTRPPFTPQHAPARKQRDHVGKPAPPK